MPSPERSTQVEGYIESKERKLFCNFARIRQACFWQFLRLAVLRLAVAFKCRAKEFASISHALNPTLSARHVEEIERRAVPALRVTTSRPRFTMCCRRTTQGDWDGTDHEDPQERDDRLNASRGSKGENPRESQAHPELPRLPARPARQSGEDRAATGGTAVRGLGGVRGRRESMHSIASKRGEANDADVKGNSGTS